MKLNKIIIFILMKISISAIASSSFEATLPLDEDINFFDTNHSWFSPDFPLSIDVENNHSSIIFQSSTLVTKDGVILNSFDFSRKKKFEGPTGYIIHFNNENETAQDHTKYIENFLLRNDQNISYTTFHYRTNYKNQNSHTSLDNLVIDGIAQVERILNQQKQPQQTVPHILLYGHELGGIIATRVAHYYKSIGIDLRLVNDNSPASYCDQVKAKKWKDSGVYTIGATASAFYKYSGWSSDKIMESWISLDPRLITYIERDFERIVFEPRSSLADVMRKKKNLHGRYYKPLESTEVHWLELDDGGCLLSKNEGHEKLKIDHEFIRQGRYVKNESNVIMHNLTHMGYSYPDGNPFSKIGCENIHLIIKDINLKKSNNKFIIHALFSIHAKKIKNIEYNTQCHFRINHREALGGVTTAVLASFCLYSIYNKVFKR
ncbi:MAG: hypothetical protein AB8C84_11085 [Oligoflexales bacterium]